MKKQIKKVQDYFKSKLLSFDFEIKHVSEHIMRIIIDSEYEFTIWIGNPNIPESRKLYRNEFNVIYFELTDDEAKSLHEYLMPAIKEFRKNTLLEQKRRDLKKLEEEIGNLT